MQRDIVVLGGSSGGIDAVKTILRALPRDLPAAVCVVLHTSPDGPGILGSILEYGMRPLEEKMLFLKHLSTHADDTPDGDGSTVTKQAQATEERAHLVRKALGTGEAQEN